jgi:hypothetical protein
MDLCLYKQTEAKAEAMIKVLIFPYSFYSTAYNVNI